MGNNCSKAKKLDLKLNRFSNWIQILILRLSIDAWKAKTWMTFKLFFVTWHGRYNFSKFENIKMHIIIIAATTIPLFVKFDNFEG